MYKFIQDFVKNRERELKIGMKIKPNILRISQFLLQILKYSLSLYMRISVEQTRKNRKRSMKPQMESRLTELEMDAVLQLIQLSGNSADDFQLFWVNFPAKTEDQNKEESVGETSSSAVINPAEEAFLPRRRKKFLPISDIYRKSQPLINNRTHKRHIL